MTMQASPGSVGHTLVAHEHDSGLVPHGFGMHFSGVVVTGPPTWCRQTNPGGHVVVPHADPAAQLSLWRDHAPLMQVAVVSDPSWGHWSYGQVWSQQAQGEPAVGGDIGQTVFEHPPQEAPLEVEVVLAVEVAPPDPLMAEPSTTTLPPQASSKLAKTKGRGSHECIQ